jgi:hypothetical protein
MTGTTYAVPPFPPQQQDAVPGRTAPMIPQPDHGEESYVGRNRLAGKAAIITGAVTAALDAPWRLPSPARGGRADLLSERA